VRIFEHGVRIEQNECWDPGDLVPVATTDLPIYAHFNLTLVDRTGTSLNEPIVNLSRPSGPYLAAEHFEEIDLRDGLLAMAYHLQQMAHLYSGIAARFEELHPENALCGNTNCPPIYYEADAFLTAAQRWYETLRRLMWKHYGRSHRPQSFRSLLKCGEVLPEEHLRLMEDSWESHGSKMNQYRDCIAHYDPLDNGIKTAWANRTNGRWGVTVRLPANPQARSRTRFDFDSGPDVMSYVHALLCHLTGLAEVTEQLPRIAAHRNKPYNKGRS